MKKQTNAELKIKKINENIILISEYKDLRTDIVLQCKICNNEWTTKLRNIMEKGKCECLNCSRKDKKEELQKTINIINKNIRIIGEYVSTIDNIELECQFCNHQWLATPSNLKRGTGCPSCAGVVKKTTEQVRIELKKVNPNLEILGEYINNSAPLKTRCCSCEYIWDPIWINLRKGHGCPVCARNKKLDLVQIQGLLENINPNIKIIGDYLGSGKPLLCSCKVCGKEWTTKWSHLQNGHGCPICNKGLVNHTRIEKFKERWEKIPAKFYLIKIFNEKEEFLKVGITRNTLNIRFKELPYNFEIIDIYEDNLYEISKLESAFFKKFHEYLYQPQLKFSGHTECFGMDLPVRAAK